MAKWEIYLSHFFHNVFNSLKHVFEAFSLHICSILERDIFKGVCCRSVVCGKGLRFSIYFPRKDGYTCLNSVCVGYFFYFEFVLHINISSQTRHMFNAYQWRLMLMFLLMMLLLLFGGRGWNGWGFKPFLNWLIRLGGRPALCGFRSICYVWLI